MIKHVASSITSTTTIAATCRFTRASERLRAAVRILALFAFAFALAGSLRASQSVSLAWNPVTTSPVAGYAVYMGTNSGVYTSRFDVGTNIDITLTGLKEGRTNFFAVASYNSARTESPASAVTSYIVPGLVQLASPSKPGSPATLSFPVAIGHSYPDSGVHKLSNLDHHRANHHLDLERLVLLSGSAKQFLFETFLPAYHELTVPPSSAMRRVRRRIARCRPLCRFPFHRVCGIVSANAICPRYPRPT